MLVSRWAEGDIEGVKTEMRALIQRVTSCGVDVEGQRIGEIGPGMLCLLGVARSDTEKAADYLADKISHLRIFDDEAGKMNRSVLESGGEILVVSQFTLLANCRKGRRPSFVDAAGPDEASRLYEYFVGRLRSKDINVATGRFQTRMAVSLVNDGPVTIMAESP
jgi:D-tyrosyl-tRNA(Tyr) deacylase